MEISERLAGFAAGAAPGEAARAMMRLSVMDWAACAIAGAEEPVSRIVRALVLEEAGAPQAALVGDAARVPARAAALANGAAAHALDYDDTHFAHIGHPSVAVVPAALALAQKTGADGAAFLDAALVGVEASIRVGVWLGRGHYQVGFHQTGTAGAFGAALAGARLLGADGALALGIVSTLASGLKSQFGTMGKPFNAGHAAASGVEAALLAARGFTSNAQGLEGLQGFGETHAGVADEGALDGLGERWLFETVSHKFHACCHGTHAMIEALRGLLPLDVDAVTAIRVVTHPRWLRVCNQPAPDTGLGAKFSYRLIAAMVLAGRDTAALSTFSDAACADPALIRLRDRVRVEADETLPETAARVIVETREGPREGAHDLDAPLPLGLRSDKLRAKAASLLGRETAARLEAVCMAGAGPDPEALARLLSQEAVVPA
ncbi:MmgE/PrpD family protein [Rhodovulum euryhalinum]|uniref:2-methylcitrate dehydratase PrpD n=1 Tax=Rhodovulum euryhalinum TaxID=35805 RepID=A0A4R2KKW1_9RHOB|nr:MmgE/PrpD family protein [Rhodovulum euryhalinum]TCO71296.1 2-methylcitrate dehydratase PrpD [Rhodovulum euryhalinum]